jgi:hypothetical protein
LSIIEVAVSGDYLLKARKKAKELGSIKNSITNGEGNLAGFLGELVVASKMKAKLYNTYDYDLIDPDGNRIDVKTKRCVSPPMPDYECSIAATNIHQECDMYVFVRVLRVYTKAWILGKLSKDDYFKRATFHKKGSIDPANKYTFKADCYNVKIKDLDNLS